MTSPTPKQQAPPLNTDVANAEKPMNMTTLQELCASNGPTSPHAVADAAKLQSHTAAWTPRLDRRQSWSKEEHKHALQLSTVGNVPTGPGFSERRQDDGPAVAAPPPPPLPEDVPLPLDAVLLSPRRRRSGSRSASVTNTYSTATTQGLHTDPELAGLPVPDLDGSATPRPQTDQGADPAMHAYRQLRFYSLSSPGASDNDDKAGEHKPAAGEAVVAVAPVAAISFGRGRYQSGPGRTSGFLSV